MAGDSIAIIQFGLGLVGKSIQKSIRGYGDPSSSYSKIEWSDSVSSLNTIKSELKALSQNFKELRLTALNLVWSAGKAGFSANDDICNKEFNFYQEALSSISNHFKNSEIPFHFHFVSSAGGLFEGQTKVNGSSIPQPQRPYGQLKLKQEELALSELGFESVSIYRLSSVYTNSNLSGRKGLIPVLVENGLRNRESTIFGSISTLRDYVLDSDVGKFIASRIFGERKLGEAIYFLVNGKASSIHEIKKIIEDISLRKLILKFTLVKTNDANMSFDPILVPEGMQNSHLKSNIKLLYNNIIMAKTR